MSWFDLLSPLFAAALALVATLLTGFFVLDHSSTVAGDSYDFWGWPEHWRTNMPTAVMLQDDTRDYGQVDDGDIDWQDPGFDRGAFVWDWSLLFSIILASYVPLRVLWMLSRVVSRRMVVALRLSKQRHA